MEYIHATCHIGQDSNAHLGMRILLVFDFCLFYNDHNPGLACKLLAVGAADFMRNTAKQAPLSDRIGKITNAICFPQP